jgi:hypothetical protein
MRDPYSTENINKTTDFNRESNDVTSTNTNGRGVGAGFFNENLIEPVPKRITTSAEYVISGKNNTWITLGRDRPASAGSGYGALGVNGAGCIDLCVGMMAGTVSGPSQTVSANPNFAADAARIYISQKTDLDQNFGLAEGKKEKNPNGENSTKGKSGIGIKADGVRIIARETGIKLVTGKGNFLDTGEFGEVNSNGDRITPSDMGSIELIAGNDTTELSLSSQLTPELSKLIKLFSPVPQPDKYSTLQPIPKGDNLVFCLKYMMVIIETIVAKMYILAQIQSQFMAAVPPAILPLPGSAVLGISSTEMLYRIGSEILSSTSPNGELKKFIDALEFDCLNKESKFYINSRYCRLT